MIYFIFLLMIEPIKRLISFLIYPFIYPFRNKIRTEVILWNEYLYKPKIFLLWLFLDDSINMENTIKYCQDLDYCLDDRKYPNWINNLEDYIYSLDTNCFNAIMDFIKSYYWSAIRNSCVNWNNYIAYKIGQMSNVFISFGLSSFLLLRQRKRGYRLEFRLFNSGKILPYIEFYLFGKWFQIGFIQMGRFEIDLWKSR